MTPRLHHIAIFRGTKSTFSWAGMPPHPPTTMEIIPPPLISNPESAPDDCSVYDAN